MKSLLTKSLAAALTFGALFSAAPVASADTIVADGAVYRQSDHNVDYYCGNRCYTEQRCVVPVERVYYTERCYSQPVYVYRPSYYSAQNYPVVSQGYHGR